MSLLLKTMNGLSQSFNIRLTERLDLSIFIKLRGGFKTLLLKLNGMVPYNSYLGELIMAIYSLKELTDSVADNINTLVQNGFRIDSDASISGKPLLFKAVLRKDFPQPMTVTIRTIMFQHKMVKTVNVICNNLPELNQLRYYRYYFIKDNIYTDLLP